MSNLDPAERDRFSALAEAWWDPRGPQRPLHELNPCRLAYVTAAVAVEGASLLDVGCGGGLLSEALARAGARVTGLDASAELIAVAAAHAAAQSLSIEYRCELSADHAIDNAAGYDIVTCMELLEHVPDPRSLLADCYALLRPGGTLFLSTINRTPAAWLGAVVAGEYLTGLLPRGTHDYRRFLRPAELAAGARALGLELEDISGMHYNPLLGRARLMPVPRINYLARLRRPGSRS